MPRSADLKAVHSAPELEKYDLLSRKAFQLAAENRCSGVSAVPRFTVKHRSCELLSMISFRLSMVAAVSQIE